MSFFSSSETLEEYFPKSQITEEDTQHRSFLLSDADRHKLQFTEESRAYSDNLMFSLLNCMESFYL